VSHDALLLDNNLYNKRELLCSWQSYLKAVKNIYFILKGKFILNMSRDLILLLIKMRLEVSNI